MALGVGTPKKYWPDSEVKHLFVLFDEFQLHCDWEVNVKIWLPFQIMGYILFL